MNFRSSILLFSLFLSLFSLSGKSEAAINDQIASTVHNITCWKGSTFLNLHVQKSILSTSYSSLLEELGVPDSAVITDLSVERLDIIGGPVDTYAVKVVSADGKKQSQFQIRISGQYGSLFTKPKGSILYTTDEKFVFDSCLVVPR
jgi:hypothetical protein